VIVISPPVMPARHARPSCPPVMPARHCEARGAEAISRLTREIASALRASQ